MVNLGTIDHPENLVTKSEKRLTFTLNNKEKINFNKDFLAVSL